VASWDAPGQPSRDTLIYDELGAKCSSSEGAGAGYCARGGLWNPITPILNPLRPSGRDRTYVGTASARGEAPRISTERSMLATRERRRADSCLGPGCCPAAAKKILQFGGEERISWRGNWSDWRRMDCLLTYGPKPHATRCGVSRYYGDKGHQGRPGRRTADGTAYAFELNIHQKTADYAQYQVPRYNPGTSRRRGRMETGARSSRRRRRGDRQRRV